MVSRIRGNVGTDKALVPISDSWFTVLTYSVATSWSSTRLRIASTSKSIARDDFPSDPLLLAIWIVLLLSWYITVGYCWCIPSSVIKFRTPRTSVEHWNRAVVSADVVEGADLVCFFDTMDIAAPFIIRSWHDCDLGSRWFASAKAYSTLTPWGSNPFEKINPISQVVSAYSKILMTISKCFCVHPDRLDPTNETAYLISNLHWEAG